MKVRIFSLLLVVAACAVLIYAAGSVNAEEKKAEITETTLFGDSAYADGIEVGFGGFAGDYGSYRLAWENSYTFAADADDAKQETRFVRYKALSPYSSTKEARLRIETDPAIPMVLDIAEDYETGEMSADGLPSELLSDDAFENAKKIKEKFTKEYNNEAGLYIKDFFKYYPIDFNATNGTTGHYLQFQNYAGIDPDVMEMFNEVNRFFRIPVLEKQRVFYCFDVGTNGKISAYARYGNTNESGSKISEEAFDFDMQGFDAGNAFYMTFDAHIEYPYTERENADAVVDTSLIPGGYGIYKLPYDNKKGEFYTDKLETVYSLDPTAYNEIVEISPDGKKLLITVSDGKKIHAEVIRLLDMKAVQRIELLDFSGKNAYKAVQHSSYDESTVEENDAKSYASSSNTAKAVKYLGCRDAELSDGGSGKLLYADGSFCLLTFQNGKYEKAMEFDVSPMDLRSGGNAENGKSVSTEKENDENCTDTESVNSLVVLGTLNSMNAEEITKISYDGSRLVIIGYYNISDELSEIFQHMRGDLYLCRLDVALADKNGLKYYGRLDTNLADFNDAAAAEAVLNTYHNDVEGIEDFFRAHSNACVQQQEKKLYVRM